MRCTPGPVHALQKVGTYRCGQCGNMQDPPGVGCSPTVNPGGQSFKVTADGGTKQGRYTSVIQIHAHCILRLILTEVSIHVHAHPSTQLSPTSSAAYTSCVKKLVTVGN